MGKSEVWSTIHSERAALDADLKSLSDAQWDTASLCDGWSVRDVLAHMTATAEMTPPKFFGSLIGSGFSFDKMVQKLIEQREQGTAADTLALFGAAINSTNHPPGPTDSWLGETLVHAEDIRRPLGLKHDYPADAVNEVVDFYRKSNLIIGGKKRAEGLTFKATDGDWSTGTGPEVAGPGASIMLAITGRSAVLGDLSGDGVATLRDRM
ncbi:MAG TPA: maleylpyruvate isomerase family mycothiol-dependent enzyme [Acidimicrobiia bacterium]|nr:maleylpyruvate isomerase family mycothiol-dependent enzyme [Acidimicrobiia bacterium]